MGEVTKVVIDTNLFVSGFGWGGKPNYVVSGGPHLLNVEKFKDVRIVNAAQFLELRSVAAK